MLPLGDDKLLISPRRGDRLSWPMRDESTPSTATAGQVIRHGAEMAPGSAVNAGIGQLQSAIFNPKRCNLNSVRRAI
jgi:hypothetical protein